ncbi:hypothetical protein CHH28_09180 [Bacterioplanes sanyensis]|uniref:Pilus assembly protein TadE n=1 Tax=Bacterioplanes sanyensis TaxID=1249553 RepID=A0A222FJL8_9GAMM|nr:tight adherence pilus pseudopilin TadF [Bacterioplanes sanyensis]ASP38842.1 hypothetical protein CHH28_09180 [Bacterioplanes sanyensis]
MICQRSQQRGVAEIELAILLPFALLLWWLLSDLSVWVQQQQRLQQLSHDWAMLLAAESHDSESDTAGAEMGDWQRWLQQQWPDNDEDDGDQSLAYSVLQLSLAQRHSWQSADCPANREQQQAERLLQLTQGDEQPTTLWVVTVCAPLPGYLISRFIPARELTGLRASSMTVAR